MNEDNRLRLEKIKQAKTQAKVKAARAKANVGGANKHTQQAILEQLRAISGRLVADRPVGLDIGQIKALVREIKAKQTIQSGDVIVDTTMIANEIKSLEKAIVEAGKDRTSEALKSPLDKLVKAVESKASQSPTEYIPYRRVVLQGNRLKWDDAIVSSVGGGGGSDVVLPTYGIARIDDASDPAYYGFENNSGDWYILRNTDSTGLWQYFAGTGGITTNWAGRAGYAYADKGAIF